MSDAVLIERHDSVALLKMNREKKRNVLDPILVEALLGALGQVQGLAEFRAVVVTGGANFCAGGDLSALGQPPIEMRRLMQVGQRIVREVVAHPLPIVAAVEGVAYGAGLSLALACDFIVADTNCSLCAAFGRVGLVPDFGLLWTLPSRVGVATTREIVMLCEPIAGDKAHELGLVDRLAEPGRTEAMALQLAGQLAQMPPATIAATKSVLARQPLSLDAMLAWEADTQALLIGTADFSEGITAFREKRAAVFRGK